MPGKPRWPKLLVGRTVTWVDAERGVLGIDDTDDCEAIRVASASGIERAAVIGGGLLGLEAAAGLRGHGVDVTVVELAGS
ncbi:MAG: FAD-dependent oxidoreductase [Solirubrobacteraceae bacterium]